MSSEYSYDEQGQFFPFFILVITALVTIPVTIGLLFPSKDPGALAPHTKTDYKPQDANLIDAQRSAQKRKERRIKRTLLVIAGWAVMAGMVYLIMVTQRTIPKLWNPYDILGISESASEKVIKKTYKELSRKYHPDKVKPDPAKNETMEILNARYVEMSKAYQALTDEDIRNNYIQFGHPDGKQSYSFGIALPQFIVSEGNGKYVVLVYTLLLGVLLPYMVGSWWYGTQRLSKEKVLMESANNLFREYEDNIDEGGIITALSVGTEFQDMFKGDRAVDDSTKLEAAILKEGQLTPFAGGLSVKDKTKLEDLDNDVRRKALSLLWAYLGRVDLGEKALNAAKYKVAPVAIALNNSFTAIALAYMNAAPLLAAMRTSQYLIQAIPPNSPPLLQLPYFTPKVVSAVQGDSKTHMSVHKFMDLPDSKRRSLTVGAGLLSKEEYTVAMNVARQLPHLRVAKAFFKVTGERFIIPSSLVSLVVKGRFIPPGSENVPEIKPEELEDIDPPEDDLDAILGRKKRDEIPSLPPIAFAPYYARDHSPKWTVFLTDSKQGKVAVQPFVFTGFEKPIFDADCKPTFAMQTIKAQFQAPPQAGNYTFVMHIVSDSYVGLDTKMEVTLHVDEASKAAEMAAEDEISEPEEDTIAGTMAALKEGGLSGATKLKKKMDSDSDDESGTDDDEDDTSETNTDTEDES